MRRPVILLVLCSALLLAGCATSDDGGEAAAAAAAADPTTTTAGPTGDGDLTAFCAGFDELAAGRVPGDPSRLDLGDGSPEDIAAAYAAQRATVEDIAAAAPAEVRDNAETYLAVIDVRAAAATGGDGARPEITPNRMAQQQEINDLLAYARQHCPDFE